jgi:hypothetical protein
MAEEQADGLLSRVRRFARDWKWAAGGVACAILLVSGCALCLLAFPGIGEPKRYPGGRDTVESFGDGTWCICKTGGGPDHPRQIHLHNCETQETLVQNIAAWRQDGNWVYAVGEDGEYAVLNFRTGFRGKYKRIVDAPKKHREGLRQLHSYWWF